MILCIFNLVELQKKNNNEKRKRERKKHKEKYIIRRPRSGNMIITNEKIAIREILKY